MSEYINQFDYTNQYDYITATIRWDCDYGEYLLFWDYRTSSEKEREQERCGFPVDDYTDVEIIELTIVHFGVANPECIIVNRD